MSSDQPVPRVLAVAAVAWLLLGAVVGVPTVAAASDGAAGPLADEDDGLLNETVDTTTDTVEGTVDGTTETVNETVDSTTDVVDGTTETVSETVDDTTVTAGEAVDTATGGTTDATTDEVTGTVDGATDAVDTTGGEATETSDAVAAATEAVAADTTDAVSATAEGDLSGATDSLDDATDEAAWLTTDRVSSAVDATSTVTSDLTGDAEPIGTTDIAGGSDAVSTSDPVETAAAATGSSLSGGSDSGAVTSQRAAREQVDRVAAADGNGVAGTDGDTTAGDNDGGEGSNALAARGPPGTVFDWPADLPVSDDAATGGALAALLAGAAGIAVRQGSAMGGTGAGTAAARSVTQAVGGGRAFGRLARMLSLFRYSQYDDSDPLELDARRQVYEAISDQPGEPITAVSDRSDVNLSTARHHVKVLQREGLVATARVRNCDRFYPAGTDDLELAAAMADESTAELLDALVRLEPASVSGLADEIGSSPSTVTHHLQKLEDDEIVVRERNGRSVDNKLSEPARAALDPETERRKHAAEQRLEAEASTDTVSGAQAD
jgi:predicted transcriptional regulator